MYILILWCQLACPDTIRAPAIVGTYDTSAQCLTIAGSLLGLLRPGVRGECLLVDTLAYKPPTPTLPQFGGGTLLTPGGLVWPHGGGEGIPAQSTQR